jgi:uncharacterized protein (TIGR00645 family)
MSGRGERSRLALERVMFGSRWLLAPIYLGLIIALAMLVVKFFQELVDTAPKLLSITTSDMIVELLSLVDLSLAANLLLMVMLAGYDNFVATFTGVAAESRPRWLSHTDYGTLKLKLMSSIIAIASVKMLEIYLNLGNMPRDKVVGYLAMFVAFAVVGVLLALMDRLASGVEPH